MTPHESRDKLLALYEGTEKALGSAFWSPVDGDPYAEQCGLDGGGSGVTYVYTVSSPQAMDHLVNAEKVAAYWKSLGMTVRLVESPIPVVFGTGGPVKSVSFSTGPARYGLDGSSLCVPGDADKLNG